jgi:ABC-type nickel/cobalt efflux system permease component RcnA
MQLTGAKFGPPVARRIAPILLILTFAALGSGLFELLHRHAHAMADASPGTAHDHHDHDHDQSPAGHDHDDNDDEQETYCTQCLCLHTGIILSKVPSLLICLGPLSAAHVFFPASPALPRVHSPIDCRGPPAV